MTKDDMKKGLVNTQAELAKIEEAARKLQNQNYADIVASARRRITQMLEHHDLDAVHAEMEGDGDKDQERPKFDPAVGGRTDRTLDVDHPNYHHAVQDSDRNADSSFRPGFDPNARQPHRE